MQLRQDLVNRTDWIAKFNQYRANNNFADAVQLIWQDWAVQDNPFYHILPNVNALIFSLVTFVPDRAIVAIESTPTEMKWSDAPIYHTHTNVFYGVTHWNCADWKNWHKALEEHYKSTSKANALWESAWLHPDNWCDILMVFSCPDTEYCRYDCDFVEYLASKQIEIGNLISNAACDLSNVILNITEAAETTSNIAKNAIPIVATGLAAYGTYRVYKSLG